MKVIDTYKCGPYFDQEMPDRPITGMIADMDISGSYELDACAVFKCKGTGYLVVYVSGCSCWPGRGGTAQVYCADKTAVDRELTGGSFNQLRHDCQAAGWKLSKTDLFKEVQDEDE